MPKGPAAPEHARESSLLLAHIPLAKVSAGQTYTPAQQVWLDRIRAHLATNLSIDDKDFAVVPILARKGRRSTAPKVFGDRLVPLIHALNEAIAA